MRSIRPYPLGAPVQAPIVKTDRVDGSRRTMWLSLDSGDLDAVTHDVVAELVNALSRNPILGKCFPLA